MDTAGNLNWVRQIASDANSFSYAMTLDNNANIYINGIFNGTTDFNYGNPPETLSASPWPDIYIAKYDSSGHFIWKNQLVLSIEGFPTGMDVDGAGNLIATGYFNDSIDTDPGTGTNYLEAQGNYDMFLEKFDPNGTMLWVKQIYSDHSINPSSLICDANDNILLSGSYSGFCDFDPGPGTFYFAGPSSGTLNGFTEKFTPNGDMLWTVPLSGEYLSFCMDITLDMNNDVLVCGMFYDTTDFDPTPTVNSLVSKGTSDAYVMKFAQDFAGISSQAVSDIVMYPNPTEAAFQLSLESAAELYIYSITGVLVKQIHYDPHQELDASGLAEGHYLLSIISNEHNQTIPFIKR